MTRTEAKILGLKKFLPEHPCQKGHLDFRYTNTGICYACKRLQMGRDYKNHTCRQLKACKKSYQKNKTKRLIGNQKWAAKNRGKSNQIKKNYKTRHREKYLAYMRNYASKKRKDPLYRANSAISKQIWSFLKGKKGGRSWQMLVGYKFEDLKIHLESQFDKKMNWNNYGSYWEIDHNIPKSWFNENFSDYEKLIKIIWKLENLQPLSLSANRSKRNHFTGKKQEIV